jgi:hypothetical protein
MYWLMIILYDAVYRYSRLRTDISRQDWIGVLHRAWEFRVVRPIIIWNELNLSWIFSEYYRLVRSGYPSVVASFSISWYNNFKFLDREWVTNGSESYRKETSPTISEVRAFPCCARALVLSRLGYGRVQLLKSLDRSDSVFVWWAEGTTR